MSYQPLNQICQHERLRCLRCGTVIARDDVQPAAALGPRPVIVNAEYVPMGDPSARPEYSVPRPRPSRWAQLRVKLSSRVVRQKWLAVSGSPLWRLGSGLVVMAVVGYLLISFMGSRMAIIRSGGLSATSATSPKAAVSTARPVPSVVGQPVKGKLGSCGAVVCVEVVPFALTPTPFVTSTPVRVVVPTPVRSVP